DEFFSILYSFSSILFAVILTEMVMWVVHHWISVILLKHPEVRKLEMN
ncbi:MFS transporter, partial [Vibrio parahaemolyticus]|nr:MFS transporter [Vibrio parahaemolyticus]